MKGEITPISKPETLEVKINSGETCPCGEELPKTYGYRAILCPRCCRIKFASVHVDLHELPLSHRKQLIRNLLAPDPECLAMKDKKLDKEEYPNDERK